MSDVFDVNPLPPEAEGLDFEYTETEQKKFHCDAGVYEAVVTAFAKADGKKGPKIKLEVTLIQDGVKGIRASRFYDVTGEWVWTLEKAVEVFGVKPVDTGQVDANGKPIKRLPLKENYNKIYNQRCRAKVEPREFNGKIFMDLKEVLATEAKDEPTDGAPF